MLEPVSLAQLTISRPARSTPKLSAPTTQSTGSHAGDFPTPPLEFSTQTRAKALCTQKARPGALGVPEAPTAFRVELGHAGRALEGRALRLTRNAVEAQDLVQETLLRALRFESSYQPGTNLKAWLNQVMFSVFVTRCRKLKRERRALDSLTFDPCAWTHRDPPAVSQGLTRSVQGALDSIPPQFASAVALVDIEEQSYKDAATRLGVPVGTVMSRLFRGRRLLAALLVEDAEPKLCAA